MDKCDIGYKNNQESVAYKQFKHKHFNINCHRYISANLSGLWNANSFPQPLFINFSWLILVLFAETTSINSVCQPNSLWMKPYSSKSPLQQHKATWQVVLQRKCAGHFSDMAFEGISSWLSLVKMFLFQFSYQCGGWPSQLCGGRGPAIRIN